MFVAILLAACGVSLLMLALLFAAAFGSYVEDMPREADTAWLTLSWGTGFAVIGASCLVLAGSYL